MARKGGKPRVSKIKRRTKRRVKNHRKKTRKKRGRGMGPSKIAKVGVGALAASSAIGKGMGHGISPSKGTAAAVNHFKTVDCSDFHIVDIVEHSEDHGQTTEHYRPVLQAALGKKRACKIMGKSMRDSNTRKTMRNSNTRKTMNNPNTGKPMSNKKANQANKRRRRRRREREKKAKAKTRSKKTDTKNGRQGKTTNNKGSNLTPGDVVAGVGLVGTAAMVGVDYQRGRRQGRNYYRRRAQTPERGQRN